METDGPIAQHRGDVQEDAAKAEVSELCHGCSIAYPGVARIARLLRLKQLAVVPTWKRDPPGRQSEMGSLVAVEQEEGGARLVLSGQWHLARITAGVRGDLMLAGYAANSVARS